MHDSHIFLLLGSVSIYLALVYSGCFVTLDLPLDLGSSINPLAKQPALRESQVKLQHRQPALNAARDSSSNGRQAADA